MKIEINRNRQNSSINKQQFKFDQIGSKIIKLAALTTAFFPAFSSPFYPFFFQSFFIQLLWYDFRYFHLSIYFDTLFCTIIQIKNWVFLLYNSKFCDTSLYFNEGKALI